MGAASTVNLPYVYQRAYLLPSFHKLFRSMGAIEQVFSFSAVRLGQFRAASFLRYGSVLEKLAFAEAGASQL
jgi:hypothetical protein